MRLAGRERTDDGRTPLTTSRAQSLRYNWGVHTDEYDTFGPWIREVRSSEDVPRLYRGHPLEFSNTLSVLKVPRDIARRDANPRMHLYDQLLIITTDSITALTRAGESYTVRELAMRDIFAIEDSVLLLDGLLTVHAIGGELLLIPYNGSDRESITRLVALLRRQATRTDAVAGEHAAGPAGKTDDIDRAARQYLPDQRDQGIRSDCSDVLRTEPGSVVLAGHSTVRLHPADGSGLRAAIAHRMNPAFLNAVVVMGGTGDLSLIHRRHWIVRDAGDDVSSARTVVIPARVVAVDVVPHPSYAAVSIVRIAAARGRVELVVAEDSGIAEVVTQYCARSGSA